MLGLIIMLALLVVIVFIPGVLSLVTTTFIPFFAFMLMWYFAILNYLRSRVESHRSSKLLVDFFIGGLTILPLALLFDRLIGFFVCTHSIYILCPASGDFGISVNPSELFLRKVIGLIIVSIISIILGRYIREHYLDQSHSSNRLSKLLFTGFGIFLIYIAISIGIIYYRSNHADQNIPSGQSYQTSPQGESHPLPQGFRQLNP